MVHVLVVPKQHDERKPTDDKKLFLSGGYQFPSETKDLPQYSGQVEFDVVQENVTRLQ